MDVVDTLGDVTFTGDQVGAFCDLLDRLGNKQTFDIQRLRDARRISRFQTVGQLEWRVVLGQNRGTVTVPIDLLTPAPPPEPPPVEPPPVDGGQG